MKIWASYRSGWILNGSKLLWQSSRYCVLLAYRTELLVLFPNMSFTLCLRSICANDYFIRRLLRLHCVNFLRITLQNRAMLVVYSFIIKISCSCFWNHSLMRMAQSIIIRKVYVTERLEFLNQLLTNKITSTFWQ